MFRFWCYFIVVEIIVGPGGGGGMGSYWINPSQFFRSLQLGYIFTKFFIDLSSSEIQLF